jgi:hypothetical protein
MIVAILICWLGNHIASELQHIKG